MAEAGSEKRIWISQWTEWLGYTLENCTVNDVDDWDNGLKVVRFFCLLFQYILTGNSQNFATFIVTVLDMYCCETATIRIHDRRRRLALEDFGMDLHNRWLLC